MYCPTCKTEIKQHGQKQCTNCNAVLFENNEKERLKIDQGPDEFDSFLEGITEEIDSMLSSDKKITGQIDLEFQHEEKPEDKELRELSELIDLIESEVRKVDETYVPDTAMESAVKPEPESRENGDRFESEPLDDFEHQVPERAEPTSETPDVVIDLTDIIEPEFQPEDEHAQQISNAEIEPPKSPEPDEFIDEIQDEVTDFLKLVDEKVPADDAPVKKISEEIIELTDSIEMKIQDDDDLIAEISQEDFEPAEAADVTFPEDIFLLKKSEDIDYESTRTLDLSDLEEEEPVGEISENDFESLAVPAAKIDEDALDEGVPATPRRSTKRVFALAGAVVLVIAAVFGIRFYLNTKPDVTVLPPRPKSILAKKKIIAPEKVIKRQDPKAVEPQPTVVDSEFQPERKSVQPPEAGSIQNARVDRRPQTQSMTAGQQNIDANEGVPMDRRPRTEGKIVEQHGIAGAKTGTVFTTEEKTPLPVQKDKRAVEPAAKTAVEKIVPTSEYVDIKGSYFTIQVESLSNESFVEPNLNHLKQKGYPAYVVEKTKGDGSVVYKLRIGKYKTRDEAQNAAESFFGTEKKSYIIVKSDVGTP